MISPRCQWFSTQIMELVAGSFCVLPRCICLPCCFFFVPFPFHCLISILILIVNIIPTITICHYLHGKISLLNIVKITSSLCLYYHLLNHNRYHYHHHYSHYHHHQHSHHHHLSDGISTAATNDWVYKESKQFLGSLRWTVMSSTHT